MPFKNTEGLKLQTSSNGIQSLSTTEYFKKKPRRIGMKSKCTVGIKVWRGDSGVGSRTLHVPISLVKDNRNKNIFINKVQTDCS